MRLIPACAIAAAAALCFAACTPNAPGPAMQPPVTEPKKSTVPAGPVATRILTRFAAMGDVPYKPGEEVLLARQLKDLPADCQFAIHVGDIQPGPKAPVTEDRYKLVAGILRKSPRPVFIVPGDNEWNDAPNVDEAWTFWMRNLHKLDESFTHGLSVSRQKERPENVAIFDGNILLIGLNLVGGRVHDAAEWKARHAQNVAWIRRCFENFSNVPCAVVFAQANPGKNHQDFLDGFIPAAASFGKPVLFLHGDGHKWIMDRPYSAKNILRVQIDMGGVAAPLMVTVTSDPAEPFTFDRRLGAATLAAPVEDK